MKSDIHPDYHTVKVVMTDGTEFTTRTNYHVANQESQNADATLRGTVVSAELAPITYDSRTGRASSALITVSMKVQLVDKAGKVLFDNPNYVYREQYQISREVSSFFEEESPAVDRMSRDFARSAPKAVRITASSCRKSASPGSFWT